MSKGNQKGSSFERSICKKLSLWWTRKKRDDIFWRTSTSGARATTRKKQNKSTANSAGDIMALDSTGEIFTKNFLIEIKRGYSQKISLLSFVDSSPKNKKPILLQWWIKAENEKKEHNKKYSLIIFKRDRKKTCICFDQKVFHLFFHQEFKPVATISTGKHKLIVFPFDTFLDKINSIPFKVKIKKMEL